MMNAVSGQFQYAGDSSNHPAWVAFADDQVKVESRTDNRTLLLCESSECRTSSVIPGLPTTLEFPDGAIFTPDDPAVRWSRLRAHGALAAKLETSRAGIVIALLLTPLLIWALIFRAMPALAGASVAIVPEGVQRQMGQQVLRGLQETVLSPTSLPESSQQIIQEQWQQALSGLPLRHTSYQLYFYESEFFGANAFALPDGSVVLTDDLVMLLNTQSDALLAILLHELGHVEHQHSVRMVAQSIGTTLILALLFGDLEGASELLLGGGGTLLQNSFSRDMEREADAFALQHLQTLGRPASAFADAMSRLLETRESNEDGALKISKYFSSHPDTAERIQAARNF